MSMAEFDAAGALARRAADAVPSLRSLPGYVGIRLDAGKITVEGTGGQLRARVDQLNAEAEGQTVFTLAAPATVSPDAPAAPAAPAAPTAPAAAAAPAAELLASSTQQLFEAYVREVGAAGLQAVTYTDGHFVIRTGGTNTAESRPAVTEPRTGQDAQPFALPGAQAKLSAAEFVARYANVALVQGARISTEEDFFGGQGYIIDGRTVCSAGFGAFSPVGEPLVLTAGHCAADGTAKQTEIEQPAGAPAAGGTGSGTAAGTLGTFGFSQFGGQGNSKVAADGTNVGTDIAVLQNIRKGLDLQPAVTRWDNPADPGPTSVKIVGTVAPFQGQPVCRSGRTLGWSCGTVDSVGTWVIAGPNSLPPDYNNDLRALNGFDSTTVKSRPGDSGGPWISGNFAVGTHTGAESDAGVQTRAIATTLEDAAGKIPGGVQLQLFLNKPTLTAAAGGTVAAGEPVTGHVAAGPASVVAPNSKVRITAQNQQAGQEAAQPLEVPVDASGNWQFPAPSSGGTFKFTAETVNGFSRSGAAALSVDVSGLAAPAITAPEGGQAGGAALAAIAAIEGAGEAGRTVRLSGGFTGTGVVGADGRWSIDVAGQHVFGKVTVTAVQTAPGQPDSPPATRTFLVMPPAPVVQGIRDGQHFREDALPAGISGTGVDGATVTVSVDGAAAGSAQAGDGGRWSIPFPSGLATGAHSLAVTQAVDGVASRPAAAEFSIDAAAASGTSGGPTDTTDTTDAGPPVPNQPAVNQPAVKQPAVNQPAAVTPANPAQVPVRPSDTSVTVGGGAAPGNANQLASTGAGGLLYAAGIGAGALLLGAAFLIFARRRTVR
ncbi:hypothetical protein CFN17_01505 [Arthrobacter sp. PM3]|nr:hypothetical protein CFN17_01505 [Arthrobacter sp. PM3]